MKYIAAVLSLVAAISAQSVPSTNQRKAYLDIPAISREANGSVVSIIMSDKEGHPVAQGSGFLISEDGWIVTNYHVIKIGNSAIAKLPDGAFFAVDGVVASDKGRDVAIIKAHGNDFRTLTLGDSARLQVGEEVVAIGNPLSLESTVSNGIISAIRTVEERGGEFLQITAPISSGSSGGPLFKMAGEVVGITSAGIKGGENLNFAIPIDDVKPMIRSVSKLRTGVGVGNALPNEAEPDEAEPVTATQTQGQRSFDELVNRKDKDIFDALLWDATYVCFPPEGVGHDVFLIVGYTGPEHGSSAPKEANTSWFKVYLDGQASLAEIAVSVGDGWRQYDGEHAYVGYLHGDEDSANAAAIMTDSASGTLSIYDDMPHSDHRPIYITIQSSTGRFVQATTRAGLAAHQFIGQCELYRRGKRIF
jgi:S1-C subfamily serine protease